MRVAAGLGGHEGQVRRAAEEVDCQCGVDSQRGCGLLAHFGEKMNKGVLQSNCIKVVLE